MQWEEVNELWAGFSPPATSAQLQFSALDEVRLVIHRQDTVTDSSSAAALLCSHVQPGLARH